METFNCFVFNKTVVNFHKINDNDITAGAYQKLFIFSLYIVAINMIHIKLANNKDPKKEIKNTCLFFSCLKTLYIPFGIIPFGSLIYDESIFFNAIFSGDSIKVIVPVL